MNVLTRFKNYLYEQQLRKVILANRSPRTSQSLDQCRSVSVLFDADDTDITDTVLAYSRTLEQNGKKIQLLGFHQKKITGEKPYPFFTSKDIAFNRLPKSEQTDAIIQAPFDLLICFFVKNNPTLNYIAAASKARCRIGNIQNDIQCFEVVIPMEKNYNFALFSRQIEHILSKMNAPVYDEATV